MIVVTEISRGGMPRQRKELLRLWTLAGLIAIQKLYLVLPGFKSLTTKKHVEVV